MMISLGGGSQYNVGSQRTEGLYEYRIQTLYITTEFKTGTEDSVENLAPACGVERTRHMNKLEF